MRVPINITRGLAAVALLGLMMLAILGFRAQEQDMQNLSEYSQEVIYWSTAQAEAEHGRFVAILGQFAVSTPDVTAEDVNRRFDIFWSRIALFREGDVGRRIREYDSELNAVGAVQEALHKHEEAVVNISSDDPPEVFQAILKDFNEAGQKLRALSVKTLAGEENRLARAREAVRDSARLTWMFSMAALALSLLLMGIMLIETRRYRRMAQESADLATRAEAASQAKSRFLTMMSHELRTPMNGVLGLLALVRQTALNDRQERLIDQAERSGRQMSLLLADILDFSDLQSESLVMSRELFSLAELADCVKHAFGPIIEREGVEVVIETDHLTTRRGAGDMVRLRQVLGHFLTFLVDVIGTRDVRVTLVWGESGIEMAIDAAVGGSDQPGWQPEAMFGRGSGEYDDFASDSLGPMIARGLISLMGGSVTLSRPVVGRAKVSISVPMDVTRERTECVRIDADTITVEAMLAALLRKLSWPLYEAGVANQRVTAILMEAGGDSEPARAARLRAENPSAHLVAIGSPMRPDVFDSVCAPPLTTDKLAQSLKRENRPLSETG